MVAATFHDQDRIGIENFLGLSCLSAFRVEAFACFLSSLGIYCAADINGVSRQGHLTRGRSLGYIVCSFLYAMIICGDDVGGCICDYCAGGGVVGWQEITVVS